MIYTSSMLLKSTERILLKKYGIMVEDFNYQNVCKCCKNMLICLRYFHTIILSWYLIKIHGKNISFLAMLSHVFCSDLITVLLCATIIKYVGSRRNGSGISLED